MRADLQAAMANLGFSGAKALLLGPNFDVYLTFGFKPSKFYYLLFPN